MYGLVNKALQEWIVKEHGDQMWLKIRKEVGIDSEVFINMKTYDDSLTYSMVGKASELTNIPGTEILESLGRYWVRFTSSQGYGKMLSMAGNDFATFLKNLNNLHERVGSTYHDLRPPMFYCESIDEKNLMLRYESERVGLTPLVVGLLKGLGDRFEVNIDLEHVKGQEEYGYDEFKIQLLASKKNGVKPDMQNV